jgi:agmatine deiminase
MITDKETNTLFLADCLEKKQSDFFKQFAEILKDKVEINLLPNTKDIWARDYMPIQVSNSKFIEYRYDPDYLQAKKYLKDKTYPDMVCDSIQLKTIKSNVIIDGGNVIKSSNSVILTDKVIIENKEEYKKVDDLIVELKKIFEVEKIIFIPWDKENEIYGHADGMIRFINDETVLLNGYFDSYPEIFKTKLFGALEKNELKIEKLMFNVKKEDKNNWAYINYLQMKDFIFIPKFEIDEDEQAFERFKEIFPEYSNRIIQVDVTDIVTHGGTLNCITWNIKT